MFKTDKSIKEQTVQSGNKEISLVNLTSSITQNLKENTTETLPTHKQTLIHSLRIEEHEGNIPIPTSPSQTMFADEEAAIRLERQNYHNDYKSSHPMWITKSNAVGAKIVTKGSLKHVANSDLMS